MKKMNLILACAATMAFSFSVNAAQTNPKSATHGVNEHRQGIGHDVIKFDQKKAVLDAQDQKKITELIANAQKNGKIEKIQVVAWADKTLPKGEAKLSDIDQKLASQRAEAIEKFIEDKTDDIDVSTFNMGEKANWFARAFNTEEAELKSMFTQQNQPAVDEAQFQVIKNLGTPSAAVLVVTMERKGQAATEYNATTVSPTANKAATTTGAATKIKDVETLVDDLSRHTNKKVAVTGHIKDRVGKQAFVLESGGIFNDEIVVVAGKGMTNRDVSSLKDGGNYTVTGTIRTVPVVEIRRELSWDLDPQIESEFEGVKAYLVADDIKPL